MSFRTGTRNTGFQQSPAFTKNTQLLQTNKMEITREEIISKVNAQDYDWFYELYNESYNKKDEIDIVYEANYGDGNEYTICMSFLKYNFFVQLEGTYSSWDSPYWDSVSFAMPYEFKETRYKAATLDYIRDQKINEVLGENETEK